MEAASFVDPRRGGSRIWEGGSSESLGWKSTVGSRGKAPVVGLLDQSPRSWWYSANYSTVEESKAVFVNLALQMAILYSDGRAGLHPNPTNPWIRHCPVPHQLTGSVSISGTPFG